ncbi:MAG TPA: hypothetical protein VMV47_09370 [Bacteroidales bacterium]|nr:hypothetical protein [Bacteroidales bacterium]
MKRNTGRILLILFFLIVIIFGCQKDNADYLGKYTGYFTFTIKTHYQVFYDDTTYTITYDGKISKYSTDLK